MSENVVKIRRLHPTRMKAAEYNRTVYQVVPEDGTAFDEVKEASFWTHVAGKLRIGDRLEVMPEDGTYFAELIVRATNRQGAQIGVLRKVDLDPVVTESVLTDYTVDWRGPHHKFGVIRIRDKTIVEKGFDTKEQATAWLATNARSLAA